MSDHELIARHLAVLMQQHARQNPDGTLTVPFRPRMIFAAMRDSGVCWICQERECNHTLEEQHVAFNRANLGKATVMLRFSAEGELLP